MSDHLSDLAELREASAEACEAAGCTYCPSLGLKEHQCDELALFEVTLAESGEDVESWGFLWIMEPGETPPGIGGPPNFYVSLKLPLVCDAAQLESFLREAAMAEAEQLEEAGPAVRSHRRTSGFVA